MSTIFVEDYMAGEMQTYQWSHVITDWRTDTSNLCERISWAESQEWEEWLKVCKGGRWLLGAWHDVVEQEEDDCRYEAIWDDTVHRNLLIPVI